MQVHSDSNYSLNDFKMYDFNFENKFDKRFGDNNNNNFKNKSNTVKFSTCSGSGTPNKFNSTFYSMNSKKNQNLLFKKKKSDFNNLIQLSNDLNQEKFNLDNSLDAYSNFFLSIEKSVPIKTKELKGKNKYLRENFFEELEKQEKINIIGKANYGFNSFNKKELNGNNNFFANENSFNYLNELKSIISMNHNTITFLKNPLFNAESS